MDPFLQIIIGGNYYVRYSPSFLIKNIQIEIKKSSSGEQYIHNGERGITYQTDVLRLVNPNESGNFFKIKIKTEYRASYFQLMQEHLHLELWNSGGSSGLFLN